MLALLPLIMSIAPSIASWLFGPTAAKTTADVVQAVGAVTGADTSTEAGITAAVATLQGKPELAAQLQVQLAGIAAAREKEQRDADAADLATRLADVASARAQTVALAQTKSNLQWAPAIISAVVLLTFGGVMVIALTAVLPAGSETLLNMLMGTLAAMATSVVSYWVGSSSGSDRKTDMIYKSTPPPS